MVIVMGRLGNDPEMRYTKDGTGVANISLAVNERWKGNDGQTQERVEWVKVVLWGKLAEVAKEYLSKGDPCFIRGKLQTRSWENKQGQKQYTTEVRADELQLMGSKRDGGEGGHERTSEPKRGGEPSGSHDYEKDDVPF